MSKVTFDYSKACSFVQEHEMEYMSGLTAQAKEKLLSRTGAGNDFLGWIDLPVDYDKEEFDRIKKAAEKIRNDSEVLLVIGIGGSYLGARAAIEFLGHSFANIVSKEIRKSPEIYYVGNSISSTYIKDLIDVVGDRDFSINMISKSGTTTEPAIAFRVFKEILEKKYGKEGAAKRIYATTDKARGAAMAMARRTGPLPIRRAPAGLFTETEKEHFHEKADLRGAGRFLLLRRAGCDCRSRLETGSRRELAG